ncbi:MAG: CPBP family intramembrane metalloprotease [Lachnospiraceae bacterium]|nr:CPBP family intramembrane metalloprotease [Lachnospiraceae bacterium]
MKTGKMILTIVVSVAALIVASILSQELLVGLLNMLADGGVPAWLYQIISGLAYIASTYIIVWFFVKKCLKEEMAAYGIPGFRIKGKWAAAAVLLPVAVSAVYLLLPGSFVTQPLDNGTKAGFVFRGIFLAGLGAGIVEEMLFRGLLMHAVIKKFGRTVGIFAPSVLFASLHIIGMKFSLLSCAQVMIAGTLVGIMFSLIALEGESVWNSAIVHALWNMIIIGGGMTIGTELNDYAVCSYVLETHSFLLTGGEFGIESSVVSMIGYLVVSLVAWRCIGGGMKRSDVL